jgi:hypothetical protein
MLTTPKSTIPQNSWEVAADSYHNEKRPAFFRKQAFFCGGGRIRTCDLRVMSPTSYQLLHPAVCRIQRYTYLSYIATIYSHASK